MHKLFIGKAIEELFTGRPSTEGSLHILHNKSFWTSFLQALQSELSEGLVIHSRPRSEAEICFQLLSPLLRRVAHSTSQIPIPEGSDIKGIVYSSALSYEVDTEERRKRRGRRPQVDFMLSGHVNSEFMYCVPVEAKRSLEMKDMAQLSEYQATLSSSVPMRSYISVGILVDEHRVRFTFSPCCFGDKVPTPITLVAPAMKWRQGPIISRPTCIALCLVPTLIVGRVELSAATAFAENWGSIRERVSKRK